MLLSASSEDGAPTPPSIPWRQKTRLKGSGPASFLPQNKTMEQKGNEYSDKFRNYSMSINKTHILLIIAKALTNKN